MATGRTLGLATEILHDAAQLLDRATCLGLLPTALRYSAGSGTPELEDTLVDAEISAEGILYGAAIFIACKSRATLRKFATVNDAGLYCTIQAADEVVWHLGLERSLFSLFYCAVRLVGYQGRCHKVGLSYGTSIIAQGVYMLTTGA